MVRIRANFELFWRLYTFIHKICLATKHIWDLFLKKDRSGFVMICDTICGYCRKEVKSAHEIEEVYMYFNGSGIWGGKTLYSLVEIGENCLQKSAEGIFG